MTDEAKRRDLRAICEESDVLDAVAEWKRRLAHFRGSLTEALLDRMAAEIREARKTTRE
jgi:hypothetical protein